MRASRESPRGAAEPSILALGPSVPGSTESAALSRLETSPACSGAGFLNLEIRRFNEAALPERFYFQNPMPIVSRAWCEIATIS